MKLLLADDEKTLRVTLADDLADAGHDVTAVADGDEALGTLSGTRFDAVVTDLKMPGADGMAVVQTARERGCEAIVITGAGSVESAVAAMRAGAFDYVQKPFSSEELLLLLDRLAERIALRGEVDRLRRTVGLRRGFGGMTGRSEAMRTLFERARAAASTDATVVLVGESGTGKEVLARAIHEESPRNEAPFVPINCATLSETLLEDELFGHEKGAFTDAKAERAGRFEQADGGTVFLDDIDDMTPATQVKLLRVLQEREVTRLGGTKTIPVDIRVVAATKIDLVEAVRAGTFREDLYYRLHVVRIDLPPLRERLEDIPLLVERFLEMHGTDLSVPGDALEAMMRCRWSGNVRQLENAIARAVALRGDAPALRMEHLLPAEEAKRASTAVLASLDSWSLSDAVAEAERVHIEKALAATNGNRTEAADLLGISRKNLWEKMKKLDLDG